MHNYEDPLDRIWLTTAERLGFVIERTPDAFATTDGQGKLLIGTDETLDKDDCLAQMILHEICHWLVQGRDARDRRDWGLDNETDRDLVKEHACLRLQAWLLDPLGLRLVLAPTTEHRAFYDALGKNPLEPVREPSSVLARRAIQRTRNEPWQLALGEALSATRDVVAIATRFASDDSLLLSRAQIPTEPHPLGFATSRIDAHCGDCAWFVENGMRSRCRQANKSAQEEWRACVRFERTFECTECGACCREAYHSVTVSPRDVIRKKHPELVVKQPDFLEVARSGERCAALHGGREAGEAYSCAIYDDRPRTCRDFTHASANCLEARRRVGLSL